MRLQRKGTEKPIEIFVALFIILAVALVMLKLFNSQITEKQKELSDVQQQQQSADQLDQARLQCEQKCTAASNNGCDLGSLASLCAQDVSPQGGYIDLNGDNQNDEDTSLLAGIGVCEDHVYCFHLVNNCCAQTINAATCENILKEWWTSQNFNAAARVNLWTTNVNPGTCVPAPGGPPVTRWDQNLPPMT